MIPRGNIFVKDFILVFKFKDGFIQYHFYLDDFLNAGDHGDQQLDIPKGRNP